MHDPRERGHAVVINSGSEPALALANQVNEITNATLFYCGAGGLATLVTNQAFDSAVRAGDPVAVIFSNPEEAFELRGRLALYPRKGTLQRPSNH